MTSTEKYVAVEVNAFGRGMQTMFQGIAEVFASMGVHPPQELEEQSRKWSPDGKGESDGHEIEAAGSEPAVPDGAAPDDVPYAGDAPVVSEEVTVKAAEDVDESGADEAEKEPEPQAEAPEPKKSAKKSSKKASKKAAEKAQDTPATTPATPPSTAPATTPAAPPTTAPATTVSQDDITKIIVQKIKQNRDNNERIGQILKSYGVAKVSDLSPGQYEAFITDLAAI